MTYLSVCSGIEAATVAWEPLGFKPIGFAEIEPFPCELLKQKYPNIKNYGDITQYEKWNIGQFDILVGGTPCQSFSIAGKRGGIADERGALMYAYLGIVETYRPRWIVWENIRRLTPLECERLQGFPDNYTQIKWNGKPKNQCPDSHRYKAIGNSMAVPVMRWIGKKIENFNKEIK